MDPINYFDILGIDSDATIGEIKSAYRKLVIKYHPDHSTSSTARKNFSRITKAYKVLADPVKRDEYVRGQSAAVTEKPWTMLNNYWDIISNKGFRQ